MPRAARIVVPDWPHHVTQRGNNRQDVFSVDDDRDVYLKLLAEQSKKHEVEVLGWCLMSNHTHLIVIPVTAEALARAIGRTHWLYSQYANRLHGRSGHLWQNRFYSAAFDFEHLPVIMRYVECNPLRARLCRKAAAYRWSSAAAHCGREKDANGMLDLMKWKNLSDGLDWSMAREDPLDQHDAQMIRRQTHSGRPWAGDSAISKMEKRLGRRLRALAIGRPRKKEQSRGAEKGKRKRSK